MFKALTNKILNFIQDLSLASPKEASVESPVSELAQSSINPTNTSSDPEAHAYNKITLPL